MNYMVNKMLWFGIGAGLGYCIFFKPDRLNEHLEMIERSKQRMKIWHQPVFWHDAYASSLMRAEQLYTPFIAAKLTEKDVRDYQSVWGGTSMARRELSLPPVKMETMDWRDQ